MAARRKVVFPEEIHRIAADIRRQALANPDKDPVVPRAKTVKRVTARRKKATTRRTARARRK